MIIFALFSLEDQSVQVGGVLRVLVVDEHRVNKAFAAASEKLQQVILAEIC